MIYLDLADLRRRDRHHGLPCLALLLDRLPGTDIVPAGALAIGGAPVYQFEQPPSQPQVLRCGGGPIEGYSQYRFESECHEGLVSAELATRSRRRRGRLPDKVSANRWRTVPFPGVHRLMRSLMSAETPGGDAGALG